MKIAVISDIHSNLYALESVIKDIKRNNISDIYCTGDLVGYGTRPNEVIKLMQENNVKTIMGNHDLEMLKIQDNKYENFDMKKWTHSLLTIESLVYIATLKDRMEFMLNDKKVALVHGSPLGISDYLRKDELDKQIGIANEMESDILIFGHTHDFYVKEFNNKILINAGSVGRPKDGIPKAGYIILEVENEIKVEYVRIEYDKEKLVDEIKKSPLPDEYAKVIMTAKV